MPRPNAAQPLIMKRPIPITSVGHPLSLLTLSVLAWLVFCASLPAANGGESREPVRPLGDRQFGERLRALERSGDGAEQARRAMLLLREGRYSSLQIKAMAKLFVQEDARYDFVIAAYPRTVDPENFYEVYDTFTSFSKVLRLHDQIQMLRASSESPASAALPPVSDEAMAEILKSVRAEGLEDSKKALARQIFTGRRRFLSRQVGELIYAPTICHPGAACGGSNDAFSSNRVPFKNKAPSEPSAVSTSKSNCLSLFKSTIPLTRHEGSNGCAVFKIFPAARFVPSISQNAIIPPPF